MNVVTSDKVAFANVMQIELSDSCIKKLADALKQKTGKWREYNYPGQEHVYCSSCKEEYYVDDLLLGRNEYPNYCPNCGAYMRGEEE